MWQCADCTHKGQKFPGGKCPACDSSRVRRSTRQPQPQLSARKPYRLILCIALWILLISEIIQRLSH